MEDARIVQLYWDRSEQAIQETDSKYGRYCYCVLTAISGLDLITKSLPGENKSEMYPHLCQIRFFCVI